MLGETYELHDSPAAAAAAADGKFEDSNPTPCCSADVGCPSSTTAAVCDATEVASPGIADVDSSAAEKRNVTSGTALSEFREEQTLQHPVDVFSPIAEGDTKAEETTRHHNPLSNLMARVSEVPPLFMSFFSFAVPSLRSRPRAASTETAAATACADVPAEMPGCASLLLPRLRQDVEQQQDAAGINSIIIKNADSSTSSAAFAAASGTTSTQEKPNVLQHFNEASTAASVADAMQSVCATPAAKAAASRPTTELAETAPLILAATERAVPTGEILAEKAAPAATRTDFVAANVRFLPVTGQAALPRACIRQRCRHVFPPSNLKMLLVGDGEAEHSVEAAASREEAEAKKMPCPLLEKTHLIYHVYEDMSAWDVDRSVAVEAFHEQQLREAHIVVLNLARRYGIDRIIDDEVLCRICLRFLDMRNILRLLSATKSAASAVAAPPLRERRRSGMLKSVASFSRKPAGASANASSSLSIQQRAPMKRNQQHREAALKTAQAGKLVRLISKASIHGRSSTLPAETDFVWESAAATRSAGAAALRCQESPTRQMSTQQHQQQRQHIECSVEQPRQLQQQLPNGFCCADACASRTSCSAIQAGPTTGLQQLQQQPDASENCLRCYKKEPSVLMTSPSTKTNQHGESNNSGRQYPAANAVASGCSAVETIGTAATPRENEATIAGGAAATATGVPKKSILRGLGWKRGEKNQEKHIRRYSESCSSSAISCASKELEAAAPRALVVERSRVSSRSSINESGEIAASERSPTKPQQQSPMQHLWADEANLLNAEEQRMEKEIMKRLEATHVRRHGAILIKLLKDQSSWNLSVDDGSAVRIWSKSGSHESTAIVFRIAGIVESPLVCVLSVLNEQDLFKDWVPYFTFPVRVGLKECVRIGQFDRVDQMDLLRIAFPWPLSDRDVCVQAWAADDLDAMGQYFVRISTCDAGEDVCGVIAPPADSGTERLPCEGAMLLQPRSPSSVNVTAVFAIDPHVRLPDYFTSFMTRVFARMAFHAFRRVCVAAQNDEHLARRKFRPYLYGFLENRIKMWEEVQAEVDFSLSEERRSSCVSSAAGGERWAQEGNKGQCNCSTSRQIECGIKECAGELDKRSNKEGEKGFFWSRKRN